MSGQRGLERFGGKINSDVLADIESWRADAELGKLTARLDSLKKPQEFLDCYAEVLIARSLLKAGCSVRVEVPTVGRFHADFEARQSDTHFFVHVKRLNTDEATQKQMNVATRLDGLKRISRPLIMGLSLRRDLTDCQMQDFVAQATRFVEGASIGDELTISGPDDSHWGTCEIVGPHPGTNVETVVTLGARFLDTRGRLLRLCDKAYSQSMPGALNVMAMAACWGDDVEDFETALLGTSYVIYDDVPPRGRVIESGLKDDGFWSGDKHPDSQVAAFFHFSRDSDTFQSKLWLRPAIAIPAGVCHILETVFWGDGAPPRRK